MCCQFSIQQHLAVSRLSCSSLQKVLMVEAVPKIESTVKASMLKNSFFGHRVLLLEFIYLLKTAQQSKKGSGCATPKENIERISTVDEEALFGFLLTVLSIWDTGLYLPEGPVQRTALKRLEMRHQSVGVAI